MSIMAQRMAAAAATVHQPNVNPPQELTTVKTERDRYRDALDAIIALPLDQRVYYVCEGIARTAREVV